MQILKKAAASTTRTKKYRIFMLTKINKIISKIQAKKKRILATSSTLVYEGLK